MGASAYGSQFCSFYSVLRKFLKLQSILGKKEPKWEEVIQGLKVADPEVGPLPKVTKNEKTARGPDLVTEMFQNIVKDQKVVPEVNHQNKNHEKNTRNVIIKRRKVKNVILLLLHLVTTMAPPLILQW